MNDVRPVAEEPVLNCEVCLEEIPESVAQSLEGEDYVHHFCGSECFDKWKARHKTDKTPDND